MSGGGAGLDSTSDANGPPQASRVDHAAITSRHGDAVRDEHNHDGRSVDHSQPDHDRHGGNFPYYSAHAHGLDQVYQPRSSPVSAHECAFCSSSRQTGRRGLGGWVKVSSCSDWECLAR